MTMLKPSEPFHGVCAMTDKPILFSAAMVRAILREIEKPGMGKTQTRRIAWRDAEFGLRYYGAAATRRWS